MDLPRVLSGELAWLGRNLPGRGPLRVSTDLVDSRFFEGMPSVWNRLVFELPVTVRNTAWRGVY